MSTKVNSQPEVIEGLPIMDNPRKTLTFIVNNGEEQQKYIVHKDYACFYSLSLKNSPFDSYDRDEAAQANYRVFNYTSDWTTFGSFDMLIRWFYQQEIILKSLDPEIDRNDQNLMSRTVKADEARLVKLWIVAESFQIPKLQNLVMDKLVKIIELFPSANTDITFVYDKTPVGSALRRFYVKRLALVMINKDFCDNPGVSYPLEFLMDAKDFIKLVAKEPKLRAVDYYVDDESLRDNKIIYEGTWANEYPLEDVELPLARVEE